MENKTGKAENKINGEKIKPKRKQQAKVKIAINMVRREKQTGYA